MIILWGGFVYVLLGRLFRRFAQFQGRRGRSVCCDQGIARAKYLKTMVSLPEGDIFEAELLESGERAVGTFVVPLLTARIPTLSKMGCPRAGISDQNLLSNVLDILDDTGHHLCGRAAVSNQGHPLAPVIIFRVPPRGMENGSLELILAGERQSSGF